MITKKAGLSPRPRSDVIQKYVIANVRRSVAKTSSRFSETTTRDRLRLLSQRRRRAAARVVNRDGLGGRGSGQRSVPGLPLPGQSLQSASWFYMLGAIVV